MAHRTIWSAKRLPDWIRRQRHRIMPTALRRRKWWQGSHGDRAAEYPICVAEAPARRRMAGVENTVGHSSARGRKRPRPGGTRSRLRHGG
jgi:hypothetical protein